MTYVPAPDRYDAMTYRRTGRSGLQLPAISLGLWNNFGDNAPLETQRAILRRAFDLGVTHIDLANNYGPPPGAAERNFGRILKEDLAALAGRADHLHQGRLRHVARPVRRVGLAASTCSPASTRACSGWGSTTSTSSTRTGFDPDTPLEETLGAVDTAVKQGKALYAGISSYSGPRTTEAVQIFKEPRHAAADPPAELLASSTAGSRRTCSTCWGRRASAASSSRRSARACSRPSTSTASPSSPAPPRARSWTKDFLNEENLGKVRALNEIAKRRGQTLAQMAIAWVLRDARITSALIGARTVEQLEDSLGALDNLDFTGDELAEIDQHAVESGINLWAASSEN